MIQATQWFREVARLANTDPLTSLANRRRFLQELHRAVRRGVRYSEHFSVVLFDLDHFKAINDARGHEVGDRVLVEVARVLTEGLRDCDVVARLGGEELGALLPETTAEAALAAAERLRGQVEAIRVLLEDGDTACVTVSIGIAAFPQHGRDERELLNTADSALYAAKRNGRNRVVVTPALS